MWGRMRRITISCPRCAAEFKSITIDEAEKILFHACIPCRKENPDFRIRPVRNAAREL